MGTRSFAALRMTLVKSTRPKMNTTMRTRSFAALRMTLVKSSRPQDEYYDGDEILRCAQDDTVMPPKDNLTKEQR